MAHGLTAHGLTNLRDAAARHVGPDLVPGLVALVANGDQVHVETPGTLSVSGPVVQRDSLWRIASVTEPRPAGISRRRCPRRAERGVNVAH